MCMYSNGPGSTRRADTVRARSSVVRSLTQLQTLPFSSGCMVSRNRAVPPSRPRISTDEYSVKSWGHDSRSLVIDQTRPIGASMTTELSVWPGISYPRSLGIDVVDDLADCHCECVFWDFQAVFVPHHLRQLHHG